MNIISWFGNPYLYWYYRVIWNILHTFWTFLHFIALQPQTLKDFTGIVYDRPTQSSEWLWSKI